MNILRAALVLPGYWLVTALALTWGALLSGFRVERRDGLIVCRRLPSWAFARGGTTLGAVYLTGDNLSEAVLRHEAVHREQWRHYGLAFIWLYPAAGRDPFRNRFEIHAGLDDGGYRRRSPRSSTVTTAEGASSADAPSPTAPPEREGRPPHRGAR